MKGWNGNQLMTGTVRVTVRLRAEEIDGSLEIMKVLCSMILALPLAAVEPEETVWYNAEGEVVAVEAAGATSAETPFVAEWRKREIERREASAGQWSGEMAPVWGGSFGVRRSYRSGGYWGYRGYSTGIRFNGGHYGGHYRSCPPGRGSGASVIIRW